MRNALVGLTLILAIASPGFSAVSCEGLFWATAAKSYTSQELGQRTREFARTSRLLAFNWFVTNRGLNEYSWEFTNQKSGGLSFKDKVKSLKSGARWLDAGAGRANAQLELLATIPNFDDSPELVAVAVKKPFFVKLPKTNKMSYLSGRFLEDITDAELGSFDIITDFFGPTSYAKDSIEIVNKYLRLIRSHGDIFISFPMEATVYRPALSKYQSLSRWIAEQLLSVGDFEVEVYNGQVIRIKPLGKTEYQLPMLEQVRFESGTPPIRIYQESDTRVRD